MNKNRVNRRDFLKAVGVVCGGVTTCLFVPGAGRGAVEESIRFSRTMLKTTRVEMLMGTFVSMTVMHSSRDKAQEALGRAMEEMRRLAAMMTRFDPSGRIFHLNAAGALYDVPPELVQVVEQGVRYQVLSHGAFDMTILPLIDSCKGRLDEGKSFDLKDAEILRAMDLVDGSALTVTPRGIRFEREGMGMTLDGIAKGYIVDRAAEVLASWGMKNFLINGGGDIRVQGASSSEGTWTVAIEDPEKKRNYPDLIHLSGGAVATSGGYELYFDREKIHHHVINPVTGRSPLLASSVSVVAPTAVQADALSTAVLVMPVKEGLDLINALPGHECLILSHSGGTAVSRKWKNFTKASASSIG